MYWSMTDICALPPWMSLNTAMTDIMSKRQRSLLMSKVRSSNTRPERILRCGLHKLGFRYKLNNANLPGRPDLVLPKYGSVIFVHGCFWHRHKKCKKASKPQTNSEFWANKFRENVRRDRKVQLELLKLGWKVIVVWECELKRDPANVVDRVASLLRSENVGEKPRCIS